MAVLMSLGVLPAAEKAPAKAKVDFSRAIRPLLANKCLKCHGPGQQQRASELRLDLRKSAIGTAIVPGRPDQSELVKRITSKDPQKRMPPPESKLELTDPEIALLKAWISDGPTTLCTGPLSRRFVRNRLRWPDPAGFSARSTVSFSHESNGPV